MKKYCYAVIILLFSCSEEIKTKVVSSYPVGNKKELISYIGDTTFLVKAEEYYENGQLAKKFEYEKDGKTKSFQTEYYENGGVKLEGGLKNGVRSGIWKAYFPTGEVQTLANYNEMGKEEGMYKVYALNDGVHYVSYSGYYRQGERRGVWNFFNKEGVVINTKSFTKTE